MSFPIRAAFSAALLIAATLSMPAKASILPECDRADVLAKINRTLTIAESNVVRSGDPVAQLRYIRQSKLRDQGPRAFAQRYCRATGITENGRKKRVYYLIEARGGFAGYTYGVEACILGRDPWKVHGAYCRSLR